MKHIKPTSVILFSAIVLSGCSVAQSTIDESSSISSESSNSTTISISESESQEITEISITETTEAELIIPDEYYEIIDAIVDYIDESDTDSYVEFDGIHDFLHLDNPKDYIAFAFVDIDGDNVAELAILDCGYSDDRLRIVELYTFFDGEVKHVASGGTRVRYYLSNEMVIYCEGSSGGMSSSVSRYIFKPELERIELIDSYYTVPNEDWESGVVCCVVSEADILSDDFESSNVEVVESFEGPFDFYGKYSIQETDLYDYGDITTLTDYCKGGV